MPRLAHASDTPLEVERPLPSGSALAHRHDCLAGYGAEQQRASSKRPRAGGERHEAAVAQSLRWAEESALRGDHGDALAWLAAIEATGDPLAPDYQAKRREWLASVDARVNVSAR